MFNLPLPLIIAIVVVILLVATIFIIKRRKSNQEQYYPESEQLYVGNLSYHVNTYHLKEFFSQYGQVQYVRLIKDNRTGRSKGFAFVTFNDAKDAKNALSASGQEIRGRAIVVRMAKPRD